MINFLGLSDRTSGLIRGKQISSKIENSEFFNSHESKVGKNQFSIMIRNHIPGIAELNKKNNKIIGYDILDMPVGDAFFRGAKDIQLKNYCHDVYDFFIVNNDLCKSELEQFIKKPIFVIPHHTTNTDYKKINLNKKVTKIGYVGLPEQLSQADKIINFCKEKNIDFVNVSPSTREKCDEIFMSLDIGLIFLDESSHSSTVIEAIKKYKPNTKLSNFQSYGIPTISIPYESFDQFGYNAYIKIQNIDELIENLNILIDDVDQRKFLSDSSYEVAKRFHIDEIVKLYKNIANDHRLL
jgi:hypothetical protein